MLHGVKWTGALYSDDIFNFDFSKNSILGCDWNLVIGADRMVFGECGRISLLLFVSVDSVLILEVFL